MSPRDVALDFWVKSFPDLCRFWAANAPALVNQAMTPEVRELWEDEEMQAIIRTQPPMLSDEGQISVRALGDGAYSCRAGTVGEHPNSAKIMVRLAIDGEWRDGKATWTIAAHPGDGSEGMAVDDLVDLTQQLESEGYETVIVSRGTIVDDD